jgi:hypothetical protein
MPQAITQAEKAMWLIRLGLENRRPELTFRGIHECSWERLVGGSWLRYFVGAPRQRTADTKPLHAAPESIGVQA